MKKEDIHLWDWQRILIGDTPWEFMLEVVLRTVIIYVILIVVIRLLGKRMSAQLSISEMSIMVTLGAIIAVPMQIPERGFLPAIVVLLCALLFQRGLNLLAFKYQKIEHLTQGKVSLLIADGCMLLDEMRKATASREQVFAVLRKKNVQHLGQVKRLYVEACGTFSLFWKEEALPGLSVLPQQDADLMDGQHKDENHYACSNCGKTVESEIKPADSCPRCGASNWSQAFSTIPANHDQYSLREAGE